MMKLNCNNSKDSKLDSPALAHDVEERGQSTQKKGRRCTDVDNQECDKKNINCEKLLCSREDHAHLRELLVTSREQVVAVAETSRLTVDEQLAVLQQANSKLVITTIEATELAEKLELAKSELEVAKSLAEKANLAKSDFLSSMSHELRTPLNAILGFAQLLESGTPEPTDSQAKKLNQITKAGWYLLELINQILELAVIESGKLSVLREVVSLNEIINECKVMIEPLSEKHNIKVHILPFDSDLKVVADTLRLKQVVFNLLTNAIKYNKRDGTVEVECSSIILGQIRISIKDSGFGLSDEKLGQLFQPFNRLGQEKGLNQGTGIGLMISKELVELMGGKIGVKSTVGLGTEFWVELAKADSVQTINEAELQEPTTLEKVKSGKYVLLYVEDNPANLMLVEQIIEDYPNIAIITATDGNMGLEMARLHQPDVILLDINLPGISGFEMLKILKNDISIAHIPVIAISANAMPHDKDKVGFQSYLTKPIKVKEFMSKLNMAFERLD